MNIKSSNNNSAIRTGTESKTIFFSQAKREDRFNYRNPQSLHILNPTIQLNGNLSKRTPGHSNDKVTYLVTENKDYNPFRKVELKKLPDTNRTIVPCKKQEIERSKSAVHIGKKQIAPPTIVNEVIKTDDAHMNYEQSVKVTYSKKFLSNVFRAQENRKFEIPKKMNHYNEYSKYTTTTQIVNLPGGRKRDTSEINDDRAANRSFCDDTKRKKFEKDFESRVSCLTPLKSIVSSLYISNRKTIIAQLSRSEII